MEIRSKLWLVIDGEPVFGRGRKLLLDAIDGCGSINQAAKQLNLSYRKAWSYIKKMEERLGVKLIVTQTGGRHGGGASLTAEARVFLAKYELMEEGLCESIDERFKEIFGGN